MAVEGRDRGDPSTGVTIERAPRRGVIAVVVAVAVLVVGGLVVARRDDGTSPGPASATGTSSTSATPTTTAPASWRRLSTNLPDADAVVAAAGDGYLAVSPSRFGSSHGELAAWHGDRDGRFLLAGTVAPADVGQLRVNALALDGDLAVAVGDAWTEPFSRGSRPIVFVSFDAGERWEEVPASSGFSAPGTATDVAIHRGKVVVAGYTGRHVHWTSPDARTWVEHDGTGAVQGIENLATDEDGFVAVGSLAGDRVAMISLDGDHWGALSNAPSGTFSGLARKGQAIVVGAQSDAPPGASARPIGWRTADGASWWELTLDAAPLGGDAIGELRTPRRWGPWFVAIASVGEGTDPQFCYQKAQACNRSSDVLLFSADGATWTPSTVRTDTTSRTMSDRPVRLEQVVVGSSLSVIQADRNDHPGSLVIHRLDRGGPPPAGRFDAPTTTTPAHPLLAEDDRDLALGETLRYPYVAGGYPSCGGSIPAFNGHPWRLVETRVEPPYPDDWPVFRSEGTDSSTTTVYATITLVRDDRIEIGVEGAGPVWIFAPDDGSPRTCPTS